MIIKLITIIINILIFSALSNLIIPNYLIDIIIGSIITFIMLNYLKKNYLNTKSYIIISIIISIIFILDTKSIIGIVVSILYIITLFIYRKEALNLKNSNTLKEKVLKNEIEYLNAFVIGNGSNCNMEIINEGKFLTDKLKELQKHADYILENISSSGKTQEYFNKVAHYFHENDIYTPLLFSRYNEKLKEIGEIYI